MMIVAAELVAIILMITIVKALHLSVQTPLKMTKTGMAI
jgi:hypothetical protein